MACVGDTGISFQFTPLREGRPPSAASQQARCKDFNSRPSARGDIAEVVDKILFHISIHAPPRGATKLELIGKIMNQFQFTPLREGRLPTNTARGTRFNFNSRPSARGDVRVDAWAVAETVISIHAPPRGATFASMHGRLQKRLFQFTPLREGRPLPVIFRRAYEYFNSRPSARGDGAVRPRYNYWLYFNSRPSARGDDYR